MSIVLIAPSFFGYYKEIIKELESRGESVFWINDRPSNQFLIKVFIRLFPSISRYFSNIHYKRKLAKISINKVDKVVVIKGESLSPRIIELLRIKFNVAEFVLYYWDSYKNMDAQSRDRVNGFDRVYSFDPVDVARDARLTYRALFYLEKYKNIKSINSNGSKILFYGTIHTDRYRVLNAIEASLPDNYAFEKLMYLPGKSIYWLKKVFDPSFARAKIKEFSFSPFSEAGLKASIESAKVVVDIERSVQTGYTMRTLEMLASKKKLITTNSNLRFADFYNENNIIIVDRINPVVSIDVIDSPWQEIDEKLVDKYSLRNWINDVVYGGSC
jgi:hypothetical protein